MESSEVSRAVAAARDRLRARPSGRRCGRRAQLGPHRVHLSLRRPCPCRAVSVGSGQQFEAEVARRLAETDSPVGARASGGTPRHALTPSLSRCGPTTSLPIAERARDTARSSSLGITHRAGRLCARTRPAPCRPAPDRSGGTTLHRSGRWRRRKVADRERTPELLDPDRELLSHTLRRVSAAINGRASGEQLLHGEPHPGNVLSTSRGPLFVDLGTCHRGPVEYDLAYAPEEVAEHYPGANQDLVHQFRILMWAGISSCAGAETTSSPTGTTGGMEGFNQLRAALDH